MTKMRQLYKDANEKLKVREEPKTLASFFRKSQSETRKKKKLEVQDCRFPSVGAFVYLFDSLSLSLSLSLCLSLSLSSLCLSSFLHFHFVPLIYFLSHQAARIALSDWFIKTVMFAVFVNSIFLAMEHYPESAGFEVRVCMKSLVVFFFFFFFLRKEKRKKKKKKETQFNTRGVIRLCWTTST